MTYELTTNDFVTYAFYFDENGELILSEIHKVNDNEINPIKQGFQYSEGAIINYQNKHANE